MTGTVDIQSAGPEAATVFSALHAKCFPEPWAASAFATLLGAPGGGGFLAQRRGFPVGFVVYRLAGEEAEVLTIGVAPAQRGAGVGARLMTAVSAACAVLGVSALLLEVGERNASARALYARLGFAPAGRRPGYYRQSDGAREDALILSKPLS